MSELGLAALGWGDAAVSTTCFERIGAIVVAQQLPDRYHSQYLDNLAYVYHQLGRHEEAMEACLAALRHAKEVGDRWNLAPALELAAALLVAGDQAEPAARLLGAAAALRVAVPRSVGVGERAMLDRQAAEVIAVLGEPAFARTWSAGQTRSLAATVTEARVVLAALAC